MEPAEYCREIEDYLCRKNEGHLIRIVGPAFEQVCGWAASGVPLKVAFRGIDQYCERYYAKGARRRPVRIEFCEADILDLFDGWRRAIGVSGRNGAEEEPVAQPVPRKPALASHVERAIARLKAPGPARPRSPTLDDAVASAVQELERIGASAKQARGDERARLIDVLAGIDRALVAASMAAIDANVAATLKREAEAELAPFGSRLAPDARSRAVAAAFERLVRESVGVPVIAYE